MRRIWASLVRVAVLGAMLGTVAGCAGKRATTRDKGLAPAASTLQALHEARGPRRYAVLVGVNETDDPTFPALKHAVDDAVDLGKVLASPERGDFDQVVVLSDRRGTQREVVLDQLRWLRDTVRREDVVVFYFSGHGTRLKDGDRWRRFLVTSDAAAGDLEGTAIDLAHLQTFFGELLAARKALVVDACFNGDGKSKVRPEWRDAPDTEPMAPRMEAMAPGEAQLFATSADRPSREDDELGHGVYTWYLIDALSWSSDAADVDGDGAVTAWEAHDWARGRTVERTQGVQLPEAMFHLQGDADVALVGGEAALQRSDDALVYLYPRAGDPLSGASLVVDGRDKGALPRVVPLEPGRHHFLLRTKEGEVVLDGTLRVQPDRAYTVDEVVRLAQGPSSALGWRLAAISAPPLGRVIGGAAVGPELSVVARDNEGPGRGFARALHLGVGVSPVRQVDGQPTLAARPVFQASGELGFQGDIRRLRARAGWGLSLAWIPPSWVDERPENPNPLEHLSSAGWLFTATGPSVTGGWVVGRGWSLTGSVRAHGAVLNPTGEGLVLVPWVTTGIGVEVVR